MVSSSVEVGSEGGFKTFGSMVAQNPFEAKLKRKLAAAKSKRNRI